MKSFFELLGFASTALLSGFLVFSYVGHKKNIEKSGLLDLKPTYGSETSASVLPELKSVSKSPSRVVSKEKTKTQKDVGINYTTEKKTLAVESVSVTEKLKNLYNDESFVNSVAKKWKKQVADASETHSVKPHLLLANVVVKSYLGNYSSSDFNRDVSEHAGDVALPTSTALKSYDYSWSVGKVAQQYNLTKYFPAPPTVAVAKVTPTFKAPTTTPKKSASAASQQQQSKPQASVSPVEAGFREMVAKEEGFTSWQGLQRLGDLETKKNAERRVKMLMSASRVR